MSLTSIKSNLKNQSGFTIVELLIVIVVIGILAAITIVSYNGITARANTNAAKGNASTFLKKAELYLNDAGTNRYPIASTELTGAAGTASYYLPGGLTVNYSTTVLTSSAGTNTIRVLKCYSGTALGSPNNIQANIVGASPTATQRIISGLTVYYWDAQAAAEASLTAGDITNCPTT